MCSRQTAAALIVSLSFILHAPGPLLGEALPGLEEARHLALEEASGETGVGIEDLVVGAEVTRLTREGEAIAVFKISEATGEAMTEVAVSLEGAIVDLDALREIDFFDALETTKISPDLVAAMDERPQDARKVIVWLAELETFQPLPIPELDSVSETDIDAFDQANGEALRAHLAPLFGAFEERLSMLDLASDHSTNAPIVWTEARAEEIAEMATWPETAYIYLSHSMEPYMNVAREAVFADFVHNTGNLGAFGRVGMVEWGAPLVALPGLLAPHGWHFKTHYQKSNCRTGSEHASNVMGVLRAQDATHKGIAPRSNARAGAACSWDETDLTKTADIIIDKGSHVINFSWGRMSGGSLSSADRYVDYVTRTRYRTFVAASGDFGEFGRLGFHMVSSPATAYSALAVGSFDDKGTASRGDDRIVSASSFGSPISRRGDRTKPDLVAPGYRLTVPSHGSAGWMEATGSSVATPIVTGTAALVLHAQPWIYFFPEALRAVLLTSANHDLRGTTTKDRMGFGGIDADAAVDTADRSKGNWGSFFSSCGPRRVDTVATVALEQGSLFRAAIAWTANPAFPANPTYALTPGADMDLLLVDSSGRTLAFSDSFDNTHEALEFWSPSDQVATLKVRRVSCTMDPGNVGWAWFNDALD